MITLTPEQEADVIANIEKQASDKYFRHLLSNGGDNPVLTKSQAAVYLGISVHTLSKLDLPTYDVTGNGSLSYRRGDLDQYMEERKSK